MPPTSGDDRPAPVTAMNPALAFAELGRVVLAETSLEEVLDRVVALARRAIPAASDVSVTMLLDEKAATTACTGPTALELDEGQYEAGYGPCLDAIRGGETITIADMAAETRWPEYTPKAVARGVRSSVSIALPVQQQLLGGLNLYAPSPEAFDEASTALGRMFADYAAVAIANAHLYTEATTLAADMRKAMESRAVIEQAKGIIMAGRHCSAEEAFTQLSQVSQRSNRKLRDVAAALVARAPNP
jgi:GAF domain-containing protein